MKILLAFGAGFVAGAAYIVLSIWRHSRQLKAQLEEIAEPAAFGDTERRYRATKPVYENHPGTYADWVESELREAWGK